MRKSTIKQLIILVILFVGTRAQASGFWCYGVQDISNDRIWLDMDDTDNGMKAPTFTQSWVDGNDMQEHYSKIHFPETICQDIGNFNLNCKSTNGSIVTLQKLNENLVKLRIVDPGTLWFENGVEYNLSFCQEK